MARHAFDNATSICSFALSRTAFGGQQSSRTSESKKSATSRTTVVSMYAAITIARAARESSRPLGKASRRWANTAM